MSGMKHNRRGLGNVPPVSVWSKVISFEGLNDEVWVRTQELNTWVVINISVDPSYNLNSSNAVRGVHNRMGRSFWISKWKKACEILYELLEFNHKDEETPRDSQQRFSILEDKIRNLGAKVSNIFLDQHFLMKSRLQTFSVQNKVYKIDLNVKATILWDIKKKYSDLVSDSTNTSVSRKKEI